jgi:hypothetical protein
MAHYMPPGTQQFPGMQTVTLNITVCDKKTIQRLQDAMMSASKIKFGRSEFWVTRLDNYAPSMTWEATLIAHGKVYPKDLIRILKSKRISFTLDVDSNPISMEHTGYTKYDWILRKELSEDHHLITRDKIPENGFLFENLLYEKRTYWCEGCHDNHDEEIVIRGESYKTKREALNGRRRLIRNWRKYK